MIVKSREVVHHYFVEIEYSTGKYQIIYTDNVLWEVFLLSGDTDDSLNVYARDVKGKLQDISFKVVNGTEMYEVIEEHLKSASTTR